MTDYKYYIPHAWEDSNTTVWEDIWIMRADGEELESDWLTVDCISYVNNQCMIDDMCKSIKKETDPKRLEGLKDMLETFVQEAEDDKEYLASIKFDSDKCFYKDESNDMVVDEYEVTKEQLMAYTKLWIIHRYGECGELVEGTYEEFGDSNDAARELTKAEEIGEKIESGDIELVKLENGIMATPEVAAMLEGPQDPINETTTVEDLEKELDDHWEKTDEND